jgi:hypothetical protein
MGAAVLGILSFAVGTVSAISQYSAQKQEANQNAKSSVEAWKDTQAQITQRRLQEQDALRQKQRAQNLEEAEAKADVAVSAAASGVSGISVDNLMADVSRRASYNRQIEEENTLNIMQQLRQQSKSTNSQAKSRINSVSAPSPLSLITNIASSGISAYTGYKKSLSPIGA